jgi:hypothetical protein
VICDRAVIVVGAFIVMYVVVMTWKKGGPRLIHRFASAYAYRLAFLIRSNTAPAFAGWPCASLTRAWKSTSASPSCTLCSRAGSAFVTRTAFRYFMGLGYTFTRENIVYKQKIECFLSPGWWLLLP